MESRGRTLLGVLIRNSESGSVDWLRRALPEPKQVFRRPQYFGAYAGAGRRFRRLNWHLGETDRDALREAGLIEPERWAPDELARAALLLAACETLPSEEHASVIEETFRKGDNMERRALLKSLALLPESQRFLKTATEASRSDVQEVFEAIACENAYPAIHFPELNFNQLVLKTLFLEVPLARVHEWRRRCNPELVRMISDYEAERAAAGRSFPADIADIRRAAEALET